MRRVFSFSSLSFLHNHTVLLILLTAIGGFLRFYNLDWDSGFYFHPDERNIDAAVSRIHFFDKLNPQFFAYGSLLLYAYRATGELLAFVTGDPLWISAWGKINIIGRAFSAFFSTASIPVMYILVRSLFAKPKMALLASLFTAFTVSFIQTAHFAITESFLALLSVLIFLLSLRMLNRPSLVSYLACGLVCGIAVATKISGLFFFLMPFTSYLLLVAKKPRSFRKFLRHSLLLIDLLAISFLFFVSFSPYTFLDWGAFMESMRYESGVATGRFIVPYTLQFSNTLPYLFQLTNLVWQLGPLFIFSILGFILLPFIEGRKNAYKLILFLAFPILYFLYVGSWHTKFIRFMVPVLPFFIVSASYVLTLLLTKGRVLGRLVVVLISAATVLWAIAFFSVYTREQTRITASRWIYNEVPPGSKIFREHWDDGLPVPLESDTPQSHQFDLEALTIYEPDDEDKLDYYTERLSQGDYIVINSRRLYGTLIHLVDKYPLTSRYYKLLFSGALGYEKVAEFSSYPSLLGITINDDVSEETFQVYEHPKVMIFHNRSRLTKEVLTLKLRL